MDTPRFYAAGHPLDTSAVYDRVKKFGFKTLPNLNDDQLRKGYAALAALYNALPNGGLQEATCLGWMQQFEAEQKRRQGAAQ